MARPKCTVFEDLASTHAVPDTLTTKWFREPEIAASKADLPLVKLARFGNVPTTNNALRHDANVLEVTGTELDYDAGEVTFEEAVHRAREAGVECLIHTSASHTREHPRWRVLAPFRRSCTGSVGYMRDHRAACTRKLAELLGVTANNESLKLSQAFYFGRVEGVPYQYSMVRGTRIDEMIEPPDEVPEELDEAEKLAAFANLPSTDAEEICRKALKGIDADCSREQWVKVGAAIHHSFQGSEEGYELFDAWSASGEKYEGRSDTRTRWRSYNTGRHSMVTASTLLYMAKPVEEDEESESVAFDTFSWEEAASDTTPPRQLVEEFLTYSAVSLVSAQPNTGKSAFALDLAICIAQGTPWCDRQVEQSRVLYVAAESPETIKTRILAHQQRGVAGVLPIDVVRERVLLTDPEAQKAFERKVLAYKRAHPDFNFMVLDTFKSATPGIEEVSHKEMSPLLGMLSALAHRLKIHIQIIHHTTKEGSHYSGSQSFGAIVDTELFIVDETDSDEEDAHGCLVGYVRQQRAVGSKGDMWFYRIEGQATGRVTNFGKPETAPVVIHLTDRDLEAERAAAAFAAAEDQDEIEREDLDRLVEAMRQGLSSRDELLATLDFGQRRLAAARARGLRDGVIVATGEGRARRYFLPTDGMQ